MTSNPCLQRARAPLAQRGATLIILLVTLVVITMLALSTVRSTMMDEKMAGNARDRDKAFQAAEAAVQTCLNKVEANDFAGIVTLTPATSPATAVWDVDANWADGAANSHEVRLTASGVPADSGLSRNARCMVEWLGANNYRVTGRATGASASTLVMLQATYSQD
jgi:type IV pilus assembly protein PilX